MRFGRHPLLCLALMLAGCGPGSGGSGVPSAGSRPDGAPDTSAPAPAPPATGAPAPEPAPPGDCRAPAGAGSAAWQGRVQALADGCLVVDERPIRIDGAAIVRRSGAVASVDALAVGQLVTVEPRAGEPGRAGRVIIEDGIGAAGRGRP